MDRERDKWTELARYDLETARAMLASGRLLYVLFCCQQAVEKAIKGLVAVRTTEMPPRIHNLARLAQVAEIASKDDERLDFLRRLSSYYIQTRYPEEIASLARGITKDMASETLRRTEEIMEWLSSIP